MIALPSPLANASSTFQRVSKQLADRLTPRVLPLGYAIEAERKTMALTSHRGQRVSYYVDHHPHGRPLLLLHSVNACASSYEMRPLFERYRGTRPVYALDLPGFGFSAREDRPYTIELFADAIREVAERTAERDSAPDVVALSLTSELAARAAVDHPSLFRSLTLISPTGFAASPPRRVPPLAVRALHAPVVAQLVFDAVASRPSVGYFLGRSFVGRPDGRLVGYAYASAHQTGARYAPISFLTGDLFTENVRDEVYARVTAPTMVIHDEDGYTRFDALGAFVAEHAHWQAERVSPTRGMPQFEQLPALASVLARFWRREG